MPCPYNLGLYNFWIQCKIDTSLEGEIKYV